MTSPAQSAEWVSSAPGTNPTSAESAGPAIQRQVAPTAKPGVYNNIADVPTNLSIPARVGTQTDTPVVGGETEATIDDRKESWGPGSNRKSNAQTEASMNAGDGQCAHVQISRTLAETLTTSAESALVVDGCASECAVYPADVQFEQGNRQAGEHVGRPCEGYTCDGATEKLAESAQVLEVHASASGEGSPGA